MSEKHQRELDEIEERISQNTMKFENLSKTVSDTSSITTMKQTIQKLNVFLHQFRLKYFLKK
jgi:cell division protein FtsL